MAGKKGQNLPQSTFIISQIVILIVGLVLAGVLYYILNIQYQPPKNSYSASGGPVTTAPASLSLELSSPSDDTLTFTPSVVVSGKTAPNSSVLISSEYNDLVVSSKSDGGFSTIFELKEGPNNINVVVFDSTGDQRSAQKVVYYSKEKMQ